MATHYAIFFVYNSDMILAVGQYSSELIQKLKELSLPFHVLKDAKRYKNAHSWATLIDFSDEAAVFAAVDALPEKPTCVLTIYEQYIRITAKINMHVGLDHALSLQTAEQCTDKYLMRQAFAQSPTKISPGFAEVHAMADIDAFMQNHDFPVILKPTNLAKSLLVTKCNNTAELHAAYENAVNLAESLYKKFTIGLTPTFIIEEFMTGHVYSVDAFTDAHGNILVLDNIVDYVIAEEAGFDDTFHFARNMPTALNPDEQAALKSCAAAGISALGMRSSPAHVEVIMTTKGPRIVEIGARNGGYRPRMHRLANNLDIIAMALESYQGRLPIIQNATNNPCGVLELFPKQNGAFVCLENQAAVEALPSLQYVRVVPAEGATIGKAKDGFKAAAIIILANDNAEQFAKDYSFVVEHATISVR